MTRRLFVVSALALAWALLPLAAPGVAAAQEDPDVIPGRYVVTLRDSEHPRQVAAQYHARAGARVHHVYEAVLNGFAGELSHGELQRAKNDPRVASVEPDRVVSIDAVQDITHSGWWGLDRIDQRALPRDGIYEYHQTGAGVRAYVLDTGIRATHEDFGGRVIGGYTAFNDGHGTNGCNGHGTHVAGTIGGTTSGVAKEVTLVPVRVLGKLLPDGTCPGSGTMADVIDGVNWVTTQHRAHGGPSVANMSLGGGVHGPLDTAVRNSISAGVTYVVAAGNATTDACNGSPARVAQALTVGATRNDDQRANFSNFGSCVDLFAPGVSVRSAWHSGDSHFANQNGTSMAAPHVAGIAALYLESLPDASAATVRSAVLGHATGGVVGDPMGSPNRLAFARFQLPELSVSISGPPNLARTESADWTVDVVNNGAGSADDLTLEVDLPSALAWTSSSAGCAHVGGVVTCALGDVGAGQGAQATITAAAAAGTGTEPVTVSAAATAGSVTGAASGVTTIYGKLAELVLELDGPATAVAGEPQTYTVKVTNLGPDTATNVTASLDLPANADYNPPDGCARTSQDTRVTCALENLAEGEEASTDFVYTPSFGAEDEWVLAASAESSEYNGVAAAAQPTAATLVYPGRADLAMTVTGPDAATVGEDHAFTATVHNAGPHAAERTSVVVNVPTGLSFRSSPSPTPGCSHASRVITCDLGPVDEAGTAGATFTLRADSSGTRTLTGTVSAAQYDGAPGNNDTTHVVEVAGGTSGGGGGGGGFGGGGFPAPAPEPSPSPSPEPVVEEPDDGHDEHPVVQDVPEDGTVSTDPDGNGATPDDPVHAAVTTPNGGTVSIWRGPTTTAAPAGWDLLGVQVDISAPAATADEPITLRFLLDSSVLPADGATGVLRNGVPVGSCPGSAIADPDPCVASQRFVGNDLELVVRTSRASAWNFGVPAHSAVDCANPPPAGFTDTDPSSVHTPNIDCLVALEVARGTSATTYGPAQPVTRGQMATFIVGALESAGVAVPPGQATFSDVEGSVHRERIGQLVAAGITQGATATTYEPAQAVTRAQMATFLVRAHAFATRTDLPAASTAFADIASSVHRESIERAAGAGLVAGRTATTYDPDAAVRRDQMATFLVRLLDAL